MKATSPLLLAIATLASLTASPAHLAAKEESLAALTAIYNGIADTIVAGNKSEDAVVRAILEHERDLALAALERAAGAPVGAAAELRTAAARIGDFATEGGAAIEPIRNRLLKAGHHHNADDSGPNAVYEEGYVVVTKKLKTEALDLGKRAAKAAEAAKVDPKEVTAIRDALTALAGKVLAAK